MDHDISKMSREDLEIQSRRMESELNVLNSRSAMNPEGFKKTMDERNKNYQAVQKRLHEMDSEETAVDPEGTAPTLSDAEGNFADDARIAQIGGIGVKDSNTNPDQVMARQRKQLEKAGVEDVAKVPASQMAGVDMSQVDDESGQRRGESRDSGPKPLKK